MEISTKAGLDKGAVSAFADAVTFDVSRPKMAFVLIAGLALIGLGMLSLLREGATLEGQFWGGILVVFFCFGLPDLIRDLFISGPALSIDREGIWDKRFSTERIPWREVQKVTIRKYKLNKMIGVEVIDSERYLKPVYSLRGLLARLNPVLRFPKLTLPTLTLTGSAEDIFAAIAHFRAQALEESSSRR